MYVSLYSSVNPLKVMFQSYRNQFMYLQSKLSDWFLCNANIDLKMVKITAGIYLFKMRNGNIRTMCGICSKLTITTPE